MGPILRRLALEALSQRPVPPLPLPLHIPRLNLDRGHFELRSSVGERKEEEDAAVVGVEETGVRFWD
jgi:hypothetical protein